METIQYLRALGRSWLVILLLMIVGGAGGFLMYTNTTALYSSTVQLVVATSSPGLDVITAQSLAASRAQSLAQLASTPPAVGDAADAAGRRGATPSVSANAGLNQPFVTIQVVDTDPVVAQAIANQFTNTLPGTLNRLEGTTSFKFALTSLAPASYPIKPFSPSKKKDLGLGIGGGLVVGISLVLLKEMLSQSVRNSDDLHELTGLRVLGTVPRDLPKVQLPASAEPRSVRAEAYRQIRTAMLTMTEPRVRTLAVTSALPGEGKTSVATNLAVSLSRAGYRVAILDADLRRPQVGKFFGITHRYGLTELLAGTTTLADAVTELNDGRLAVVTAGSIPSDPSELLGRESLDDLVKQLSADFDFVVIDTPPVLPVTDALVIAPRLDGLVLVTRLGRTSREEVHHACDMIAGIGAPILGLVSNQAGKGSDRAYRYPYSSKDSAEDAQRDGGDAPRHRHIGYRRRRRNGSS